MDHKAVLRRAGTIHYNSVQFLSSGWDLSNISETRCYYTSSQKDRSWSALGGQLPSYFQLDIHIQVAGTLCEWTAAWISRWEHFIARSSICIQEVPFHRDSDLESVIGCVCYCWHWSSVISGASRPKLSIWHCGFQNSHGQASSFFGLHDRVLDWFGSYLSGRTMCVRYNGCTSNTIILHCGVPQGSVLGPVVFILYYADVIKIASKQGLKVHSYADDVQLYDHAVANSCSTLVSRMSACVLEINEWMASNRLKLNPAKT